MELIMLPRGQVRCLYDEAIDCQLLGKVTIERASHVEPTLDGHWTADLSPVGGPLIGPLPTRTAALRAEQAWLNQHWLTPTR